MLSASVAFAITLVSPRIQVTYRKVNAENLPVSVIHTIATTTETGTPSPFLEINIVDNGIGFDEKYLDRIFQVFQRLHGKDVYAGSGIGLAICRKVVENHRGALTATSQPGSGATFSVYLPISQL